jgi:hypothetical protein
MISDGREESTFSFDDNNKYIVLVSRFEVRGSRIDGSHVDACRRDAVSSRAIGSVRCGGDSFFHVEENGRPCLVGSVIKTISTTVQQLC